MKPASLSARITTLLVVTSLLVLGGGARLMDWRIDREMDSRFQQDLLTRANALSAMVQLEQGVAPGGRNPLRQAGALGGDSRTYYEVRCDGALALQSTPPPPVTPSNWTRTLDTQPHFDTLRHEDQQLATVRFALPGTGATVPDGGAQPRACVLLFEQDRRAVEQILLAVDWILLLGPVLALAVALIAVPLIVRRGLRPVAALVERMRDIGPHAPGQRLAASGMRELDPLVARFNDVLERMDDGLARERQFASGLAHETRTRLAELRALTEVESRYPSGRSLPEILAEVGHIGGELEATVTALLLLTRLQSGLEQPQWQALPLGPWLERQLRRQRSVADSRGLLLRMEGVAPACLRSDPALLEVIVGNLLGNACAYAPAGDTVQVRVAATELSIDNAAPGLAAEDLAHFGQRFWRKELPHAGHAGLGLALVNVTAQALGLQLDFRLTAEQRLRATLRWPAPMTMPR